MTKNLKYIKAFLLSGMLVVSACSQNEQENEQIFDASDQEEAAITREQEEVVGASEQEEVVAESVVPQIDLIGQLRTICYDETLIWIAGMMRETNWTPAEYTNFTWLGEASRGDRQRLFFDATISSGNEVVGSSQGVGGLAVSRGSVLFVQTKKHTGRMYCEFNAEASLTDINLITTTYEICRDRSGVCDAETRECRGERCWGADSYVEQSVIPPKNHRDNE